MLKVVRPVVVEVVVPSVRVLRAMQRVMGEPQRVLHRWIT